MKLHLVLSFHFSFHLNFLNAPREGWGEDGGMQLYSKETYQQLAQLGHEG